MLLSDAVEFETLEKKFKLFEVSKVCIHCAVTKKKALSCVSSAGGWQRTFTNESDKTMLSW